MEQKEIRAVLREALPLVEERSPLSELETEIAITEHRQVATFDQSAHRTHGRVEPGVPEIGYYIKVSSHLREGCCNELLGLHLGNELEPLERAGVLGLCDLSVLPRHGFKGWAALEWGRSCGAAIAAENNRAAAQEDGTTIARLADSEILLLGDLEGRAALADRLMEAWSKTTPEGVYAVPRADANCWFALTGAHAAAMLAKLCGVDLRAPRFAAGAVAQTSVARLNAILVRGDLGTTPLIHLLTDFASARS